MLWKSGVLHCSLWDIQTIHFPYMNVKSTVTWGGGGSSRRGGKGLNGAGEGGKKLVDVRGRGRGNGQTYLPLQLLLLSAPPNSTKLSLTQPFLQDKKKSLQWTLN